MISLSHAAWAIVNSIWQGAVVAGIAWMALRLARRASAAVRYYVWAAVLVAAFVLPIINLFVPERIILIAPAVARESQVAANPAPAGRAGAPILTATATARRRPSPASVAPAATSVVP